MAGDRRQAHGLGPRLRRRTARGPARRPPDAGTFPPAALPGPIITVGAQDRAKFTLDSEPNSLEGYDGREHLSKRASTRAPCQARHSPIRIRGYR
jgi:hypothetical protein